MMKVNSSRFGIEPLNSYDFEVSDRNMIFATSELHIQYQIVRIIFSNWKVMTVFGLEFGFVCVCMSRDFLKESESWNWTIFTEVDQDSFVNLDERSYH